MFVDCGNYFKQCIKSWEELTAPPHYNFHCPLTRWNSSFAMNDDLFRAIETSDFEALRRFLAIQGGVDATVAVPLSDNAPHNRTESHQTPMVVTPLMVACKLANRDAVRILVSSNCNVNKTTSINGAPRALYKRSFSHPDFWATPLILASAAGHRDIVEVLLKSRASPDKTSIINHRLEAVSPLFVACSGRTGDVTTRNDASFFDPGSVDASSAIQSGRERRSNFHIVDLLLRYGARVNVFCCGLAPIHVACRVGDAEVVAALIRNGSSVNCKDDEFGCTPLHEASKMGWVSTVKVLLASGANVDALSSTQNTDFARAYQSLLPRLPIKGTHVIRCGVSALTLAVAGRHWDTMNALLEHESNPNVPDTHGRVPLHFLCGGRRLSGGSVPENRRAAEEEEAELRAFHQLHRAGADLERRDHNGFKGMHYAAATNRSRLLEVWVAQLGRHVVNRGSNKETCLHLACAFGAADALSVLLESGKFIQAYNDDGLLPFHLACAHGHCRVVEVLLRRGICPYDIPTLNGENGIWVRVVLFACDSGMILLLTVFELMYVVFASLRANSSRRATGMWTLSDSSSDGPVGTVRRA